jgi:hypothetical protein
MVFRALGSHLKRPNGCRACEVRDAPQPTFCNPPILFSKTSTRALCGYRWMGANPDPSVSCPCHADTSLQPAALDCVRAFSSHTRPDDRTSDAPSPPPRGYPRRFDLACPHERSRVRPHRYPRQGRLPLRKFPRRTKGSFTALPPLPYRTPSLTAPIRGLLGAGSSKELRTG